MRTRIIVLVTLVLSTEALAQSTVRFHTILIDGAPSIAVTQVALQTADSSPSSNAGQRWTVLAAFASPINSTIQGNPRAPSARRLAQARQQRAAGELGEGVLRNLRSLTPALGNDSTAGTLNVTELS